MKDSDIKKPHLDQVSRIFTGLSFEENLFLNKQRSKLLDRLDKLFLEGSNNRRK